MDEVLQTGKALADKNRLRVVAVLLSKGELCSCQISDLLGIAPATVSRHMGVLLAADLIKSRREGRWTHYRISPGIDPLLRSWLEQRLIPSVEAFNDREKLCHILSCEARRHPQSQKQKESCHAR